MANAVYISGQCRDKLAAMCSLAFHKCMLWSQSTDGVLSALCNLCCTVCFMSGVLGVATPNQWCKAPLQSYWGFLAMHGLYKAKPAPYAVLWILPSHMLACFDLCLTAGTKQCDFDKLNCGYNTSVRCNISLSGAALFGLVCAMGSPKHSHYSREPGEPQQGLWL